MIWCFNFPSHWFTVLLSNISLKADKGLQSSNSLWHYRTVVCPNISCPHWLCKMSNVVFLKGFSECTIKDKMLLMRDDDGDAVNVLNLTANFKLCSKSSASCTLCLVIHTELHIRVDNNTENEEHSGIAEKEDDSEEMRNVKGITKDYMQPFIMTLHVIK